MVQIFSALSIFVNFINVFIYFAPNPVNNRFCNSLLGPCIMELLLYINHHYKWQKLMKWPFYCQIIKILGTFLFSSLCMSRQSIVYLLMYSSWWCQFQGVNLFYLRAWKQTYCSLTILSGSVGRGLPRCDRQHNHRFPVNRADHRFRKESSRGPCRRVDVSGSVTSILNNTRILWTREKVRGCSWMLPRSSPCHLEARVIFVIFVIVLVYEHSRSREADHLATS